MNERLIVENPIRAPVERFSLFHLKFNKKLSDLQKAESNKNGG